ncbi:hypothetical protein [Nocardia sp. NPDC058705]|uniref:hypothetical protein n=1 Tax=Nocardia sp. NPDC058705 TaxID=3346609 RepID=UPI0036B5C497
MTSFEFDPDQVRTLGQGFHQAANAVALVDVDGNADLLGAALPGSLTAAMCTTVNEIAANAQQLATADVRSIGQLSLVAVSEVTGKDETIADDIAQQAQAIQ